ncbi:MAG: hypothetical protein AAB401_10040, partial [Acidobacteriota bacterium]
MNIQQTKQILFLAIAVFSLALFGQALSADDAETKAIAFLSREVPAWPKTNGCFSCHNISGFEKDKPI